MSYVPNRGDIVWLNFDPQSGREQAGRRPALVLSDGAYNQKTNLCIACPITSRVKGYPFEVALGEDALIKGVVLSDQVKSLDWNQRRAEFAEDATSDVLERTSHNLAALLHWEG